MMQRTTHSPNRRLRGLVAMAGAVLLTGGLLACSSDDGEQSAQSTSDEKETTTTTEAVSDVAVEIGQELRAQPGFEEMTEEDATCFGATMVDGLDEERALEVFESDDDLTSLPAGDQVVVKDAFNDCVPGAVVAEDIVSEFYSGIGSSDGPADEVVTCMSDAIDGRAGDVLFESLAAEANDTKPTVTLAGLEECVPDDVRAEVFVTAFLAEGAPADQAQCVADELVSELTLEDLIDLDASGEVSPEFQALATAAREACT